MTLAELLRREMASHHKWGTRDLASATKVSRGAIEAILKGSTRAPTHETLVRFSDYFNISVIQLMRMAGMRVDEAPEDQTLEQRAIALTRAMPQFAEVIRRAMELSPAELAGVLAYLEAVLRQRGEEGDDTAE